MEEDKVLAGDIDLIQTCGACPEQYDAYYKCMLLVGYVRLRWGYLSVRCPDSTGEVVYSAELDNSWAGCFEDDNQRDYHLQKARESIADYLNSHEEAMRP